MDPQHQGIFSSGRISARNVSVTAERMSGAFVFSPVKAARLTSCRLVLSGRYGLSWQWVQMNRTEQCTFSEVTSRICRRAFAAADKFAKSYLAFK